MIDKQKWRGRDPRWGRVNIARAIFRMQAPPAKSKATNQIGETIGCTLGGNEKRALASSTAYKAIVNKIKPLLVRFDRESFGSGIYPYFSMPKSDITASPIPSRSPLKFI